MQRHYVLVPFTISVLLAGHESALAAESEPAYLEEIIVTAEKRAVGLQDVPIAISAYTSQARDALGIDSVQDMTNFTPGLSYSTSMDRATLRGIGRLTNNLASEPGVANYVDGIYTQSTFEVGRSPLFVERVEVLRGPQGTLYGRNSIAGAINIISKRPTDDWTGELRAGYGNFDRTTVQGAVSGPISDTVGIRLGGGWDKQTRGYFDNASGGRDEGGVIDQIYGEAQIQFKPTDELDLWLKVASYSWDNGGSGRSSAFTGPYDYAAVPIGFLSPGMAAGYLQPGHLAVGTVTTNPAVADLRKFNTNTPATVTLDDSLIVASSASYQFPDVELKYIGGYQQYLYQDVDDFDDTSVVSYQRPCTPAAPGCTGPLTIYASGIATYEEDKSWHSHELNLASTHEGPLQWIVGAYLYKEQYDQPVRVGVPEQPQVRSPLALTGMPAAPEPTGMVYYTDQSMRMTSQAVFGQIDWAFTDTWKTTLGLRYTDDEKEGAEFSRLICFDICFAGAAIDITPVATNSGVGVPGVSQVRTIDPTTGYARRGLAARWNATTGTAGLEWSPDSDSLIYGRYSRGYKAGGFNSGNLNSAPLTEQERVDAFEIGAKKNFGHTFQINASIFDYAYVDAQVPVSVNPPTGPTLSVFYNIPKIRSAGVELETVWAPTANLQILANYAFLDVEIREACCIIDVADPLAQQPDAQPSGPASSSGQGQDLRGNVMPQSPRHKVALNTNYTFDIAGSSLVLSGTYVWRDVQYGSIFTRPYNRAPSWDQVDLRATWTDRTEHYSVVGYVRNAFDEIGYDGGATANANTGGIVGTTYSLTPPRTFGVEIQTRF